MFGFVHALPAGCAHQRVVVQRGHHPGAAVVREPRQVERQVEEVVDVHHVRLHGLQHRLQAAAHYGAAVRVLEAVAVPVVGDLRHRQTGVDAPVHAAVGLGRVERGAGDRDVMPPVEQCAAEVVGVDFRSRLVPGQKVVNRVQDTQGMGRHLARGALW